MDKYIEYITSFVPDHKKPKIVFNKSNRMAIGRVNIYLGGNNIQTRQYYHIVALETEPPNIFDGNKTIYCHKHHVVMLPPEHEYRIGRMFCTCGYYYYLIVDRKLIEQISQEFFGVTLSPGVMQSTVSLQAISLLNQVGAELAQKKPGYETVSKCLLSVFFTHMFREMRFDDYSRALIDTGGITRACEYIQQYYNSHIDIDELARIANFSRYHFIRQFKQATGYTPYHYIKQLRLQKGHALLTDTNLTVSEIAGICGFLSPSHFTSDFKSKFHMTPSRLREETKTAFSG